MSSIHIQNLSFKYKLGERKKGGGIFRGVYKTRTVLKNVSLEFSNGDIVGLIGHNGGGKSTLLKILSGAIQPSSGSLEIVGNMLSLLDRSSGTMREATLYQNAKLKAASLGLKGKEAGKFINSCLKDSALESRANDPLRTLSTGMSGRFNLALNTQIIKPVTILDEWISTLDTQTVRREGMLERLVREADIVVLASHNRGLIQRVCNKVVLLDEGKIIYTGTDIEHAYKRLDEPTVESSPLISAGQKQPLHFLRIPETANYLVREMLKEAVSPMYTMRFQPNNVLLADIPEGEKVCLFYRDPIERYVRSFNVRLNRGGGHYPKKWDAYEREIFSKYKSPCALANLLASDDNMQLLEAAQCLQRIPRVKNHMSFWLESPIYLQNRREDIVFAGNAGNIKSLITGLSGVLAYTIEWEAMMPQDLDDNNKCYSDSFSESALTAMRAWYQQDYQILEYLESLTGQTRNG